MPSPAPEPPEIAAARPERKPSVWRPQPIPTRGIGRSTEDPRTPTRRELAARAARASLVAAPAAPAPAGAPAGLPPNPTRAQCQAAWAQVQDRTRQVLNAGGGGETPRANQSRNRAISAAYAELAQGDPRMRWAGIASVVSTQAHCAMEDAETAVGRADAAHRTAPGLADGAARAAASTLPGVGPLVAPLAGARARRAVAAETAQMAGMAREVQDALYDTNREIFSDIYPAVAMYKAEGLRGVLPRAEGGCGDERPDRRMPEAIQGALRRIDSGDVAKGSLELARYEQTDIVQDRIYEDPRRPLLKPAMRLNQTISDIPVVSDAANLLMKARKPEVAISTECGRGTPVPFRGDITVAGDRVDYYQRLVSEYMRRDQAARDAMGRVIAGRDPLRGGPDYTYPPSPWQLGFP